MTAKRHAKPRTNVSFSSTEYDILADLLRISQQTLIECADGLNKVHPSSALVERLRVEAETAADLRERIEAR